jgi:hypothetical protein
MIHGQSTLTFAVPDGIAGRNRKNPQGRTNAFPPHSGSLQDPAFSLGVFLGLSFSGIGLAWLFLANRAPHFDQFAGERNLALAVAFALLGIIPTFRFVRSPGRSFLSGMIGWAILTAIYSVAELGFPRLATRLSAFHLFILGCMVFGLLAVLAWAVNLVIMFRRARQQQMDGRIGLQYAAGSR